jgi:MFS family permease
MSPQTHAESPPPGQDTGLLPLKGLLNLNAGWLGLAYLWNGLHAILLPVIVAALAPGALKATTLGALTFTGLMVAMVTQPIAGAISDRSGWLGRFGKRRPWMTLGAAATVVLLLLLAPASSLWGVVVLYTAMQLASAFTEASLQSLLPDQVPSQQRGKASGYKNAFQIAGFVAGVGLGGYLAGRGHVGWALVATAGVLAGTVAWTVLGVHEQPVRFARAHAIGATEAVRTAFGSFRIDRDAAPGYKRLLVGRGFIMAGFFVLQSFAQYFIADKLAVANPAATTALLMAIMGAAIFLLAVPTGALADRLGRRPLNLLAGVLGAASTTALVFVGNLPQLVVAGGLVGAAVGIFLSVNWAWAADMVPPDEAGRYLGLSNIATAGASAVARLLAGPMVDGGNFLSQGAGYEILFFTLGAGMLVGVWLLAGVPETRPQPAQPVPEAIQANPSDRGAP